MDIPLSDYRIYDMQGDTVAKKVRGLNDLKIITRNAYDLQEETVEELKQSGFIVDSRKKASVRMKSLIEKIESFRLRVSLNAINFALLDFGSQEFRRCI
jgi:hypothetical protein